MYLVVATMTNGELYHDDYSSHEKLEDAQVAFDNLVSNDQTHTASICTVVESSDYDDLSPLGNIDYDKLREQKAILYNMIMDWGEADDPDQREQAQEVEGIMHLIDAIQDYAVKTRKKTEKEVFNSED